MFHTKPTPEDVDCRYCTEYFRGECTAPTCPYLADRIEIGAVGYTNTPCTRIKAKPSHSVSPKKPITQRTPKKTNNEELISAYECDPHTDDAEFLFSKRQYKIFTGREQNEDVFVYQIRQSFKPGEVTPEQANEIGYKLAQRFLKGKHTFIVCTHVDKSHIHSHIIFNSTSLDCKHKFRDFLGSDRAVTRLSDIICLEHGLLNYNELKNKSSDATARFNDLSEQIKTAEKRMAEIVVLKTHIINYSKTWDVYAEYRKSGYLE